MPVIQVVDDERHILDVVEYILQDNGYRVHCATNGEEALATFRYREPDLVLLDLNLPDVAGLDLFRALRGERAQLPIIMLTARDEEIDRVIGLEMGADDYITKPFSNRELVARVGAVLRRTTLQPATRDRLVHGRLVMDRVALTAHYHDQALPLTHQEYKLLEALVENPARNFTRAALMDRLHDPSHAVTDRSIDAGMSRLRRKLTAIRPEPNPIVTVYGVGYKLNAALAEEPA